MPLTVRVPASTSNLGAGFDCVGLALDLWLEVRLVRRAQGAHYEGTLSGLDPTADVIDHTLRQHGVPSTMHVWARSDIPVGKGLGSSAAALVAALALAQLFAGRRLDRDEVFREATRTEGHPDNAGPAVHGGLFLAAQTPARLVFHPSLGVALAVPSRPLSTHTARARLPAEVARETAIGQAARAAALLLGLTRGQRDLITFGMDDLIAVPHRKDMIPGYDAAVAAGREAGAHGVTISGAGSALLAIAPREGAGTVAQAMARALAAAGNAASPLTPAVSDTGLTVVQD